MGTLPHVCECVGMGGGRASLSESACERATRMCLRCMRQCVRVGGFLGFCEENIIKKKKNKEGSLCR